MDTPDSRVGRIGWMGTGTFAAAAALVAALVWAAPQAALAGDACSALGLGNANAMHEALANALKGVAPNKASNGGLGNHMWATLVDQDGKVCAVAFTGPDRIAQWPGSRVISAQKANTAAAFNLPSGLGGTVDALSTGNLWTQVQPGGSLYGLQFSNPVDPSVAYGQPGPGGDAGKYGTKEDPMIGSFIGGVNVFGGGLGLYATSGKKVGGVGVSGDTSCADHNIAWRLRHALNLDKLTIGGVKGLSPAPFQDKIIYDVNPADKAHAADNSASGFGHPLCGFNEQNAVLPATQ